MNTFANHIYFQTAATLIGLLSCVAGVLRLPFAVIMTVFTNFGEVSIIEYVEAVILIAVGVLIVVAARHHHPGYMLLAVIIYVRGFTSNTYSLSAKLQAINTVALLLGCCLYILIGYAVIISAPALRPQDLKILKQKYFVNGPVHQAFCSAKFSDRLIVSAFQCRCQRQCRCLLNIIYHLVSLPEVCVIHRADYRYVDI